MRHVLLVGALLLAGCSSGEMVAASPSPIPSWVYQLQNYPDGRLDAIARGRYQTAVVDLARDAQKSYFTKDEIAAVRATGKRVLAYFEIGSIENFRPEYRATRASRLVLNKWADWPDEYFVRYWEVSWWDQVVRPRVDRALAAGFDGVYLDTPLAYEEIDLSLVDGETRETLGRKMVDLIARISQYAKRARPGFLVFPQNSPELQAYPGYTAAIDGIGMEELFFRATDEQCTQDFCQENLDDTRKLRSAGKLVLAVDYARSAGNVGRACQRYRDEGFTGYVTVRELDQTRPPCP
jgi:cysteinyl-tRNA synthetase